MILITLKGLPTTIYLNEVIGIARNMVEVEKMVSDFVMHYYKNVKTISFIDDNVNVTFERFKKERKARFTIERFEMGKWKKL